MNYINKLINLIYPTSEDEDSSRIETNLKSDSLDNNSNNSNNLNNSETLLDYQFPIRINPFNSPFNNLIKHESSLIDIRKDILDLTNSIDINNENIIEELNEQGEIISSCVTDTTGVEHNLDTSINIVHRMKSVMTNLMKYFTITYWTEDKPNTKSNRKSNTNTNIVNRNGINDEQDPELISELNQIKNKKIASNSDDFFDFFLNSFRKIKNDGLVMSEILDEQMEDIQNLDSNLINNNVKVKKCNNEIQDMLF
tara:strand:- start:524 stop:1285 length:762 start_codon:yes stop_codon:yes gene_type:complete